MESSTPRISRSKQHKKSYLEFHRISHGITRARLPTSLQFFVAWILRWTLFQSAVHFAIVERRRCLQSDGNEDLERLFEAIKWSLWAEQRICGGNWRFSSGFFELSWSSTETCSCCLPSLPDEWSLSSESEWAKNMRNAFTTFDPLSVITTRTYNEVDYYIAHLKMYNI